MSNEELLKRINENYSIGIEANREWSEKAVEDLAFLDDDNQWAREDKIKRGKLPCLVVNKVAPMVEMLVNDFSQNNISIIYRPTDTMDDVKTSDIMSGLIKYIQQKTDADQAYIAAFKQVLTCGKAFMRVTTEYKNEMSFDQDYRIECVESPNNVVIDPSFTALDGSDIEWAFVLSDIPESKYKSQFGKDAPKTSKYDENKPLCSDAGQDYVRIAEYYEKVNEEITIVQLADGSVIEKSLANPMIPIVASRKSFKISIKYYKTDGINILESGLWPGTIIPVIPVLGAYVLLDGKRDYRGLVRNCKGPQRAFNWWQSSLAEMISAAATSPWIAAEGSLVNEEDWLGGSKKALLKYHSFDNITSQPFPAPQRNAYEAPIQSILAALATSEQALKGTSNLYDPLMGQRDSGNQSGIAIARLQTAGQTANYNYIKSMESAIQIIGRIIFETLPAFYNTKRVVKVIGQDEKEQTVRVVPNGPGDPVNKIFSLETRDYDILVDSGPGYSTQRQENMAILMELVKAVPAIGQIGGDIIASQLDSLIADKLSKRLKKAINPQFLDESDQEQEGEQEPLPPEIMAELEKNRTIIQDQATTLNALSQKIELEQYAIDSKERISLLDNETKLTIEMLKLGAMNPALKLQGEIDSRQNVLNAENPSQHNMQPTQQMQQQMPEQAQPAYEDPFLQSLHESALKDEGVE